MWVTTSTTVARPSLNQAGHGTQRRSGCSARSRSLSLANLATMSMISGGSVSAARGVLRFAVAESDGATSGRFLRTEASFSRRLEALGE